MKFEEILPLMREGNKARIVGTTDGSHWVCCYQSIAFEPGEEDKCLSLAKIEADGFESADRHSWGIPRWAIMAEWELVE